VDEESKTDSVMQDFASSTVEIKIVNTGDADASAIKTKIMTTTAAIRRTTIGLGHSIQVPPPYL
jgi:hypothetical protein